MGALILPRRLQSHPGRPLELDLNNPFGVTAIGLHGFAATRSGIILPTVSTAILDDSGPFGPAYTQPSSANTQVTYGDGEDWRPAFPFTVMMGFAPSVDSAVAQFATSSDGNTNIAGWSLLTTAATTNYKLTLRLGDNGGTLLANRSDFAHSTRITLNSRHVGGGVVRSITDADVVLDDAFETPTRGGTAASMVYGSGPSGFGARTTQALCPGTYDFLLVANRALSRDEWYALAANPYQVLRATPRRIYFDVGAGGGSSIDPTKVTLTLTGKTPTISQPIAVAPAAGRATITGYAPSVTQSAAVSPDVGHVALTGYAPAISQPITVAPDVGHVAVTGYAPGVSQPITVSPDTGHVTLTGYAPSLTQPNAVSPAQGTVLVSGKTPSIDQGAGQSVNPDTGHLSVSGQQPSVSQPISVSPDVAHVLLTGKQPSVSQEAGTTLAPDTANLSLTGYAPTLQQPITVSPEVAHVALTGQQPIVVLGVQISPATGRVTLTGQTPSIDQPRSISITAGRVSVTGRVPGVVQSSRAAQTQTLREFSKFVRPVASSYVVRIEPDRPVVRVLTDFYVTRT